MQRDLLPLIEGTTVTTKHGPVKTDHILFIASGAFHLAKPSDLLPELQGRLPIRVELAALTRDDFRRILTEPEHSLIKQYVALLGTEGVALDFADDAVDAIADLAADINAKVENIGARRLATVLERLLEEISFTASDRSGEAVRGRRATTCARRWRRWPAAPTSAATSCKRGQGAARRWNTSEARATTMPSLRTVKRFSSNSPSSARYIQCSNSTRRSQSPGGSA